MEKRKQKSRRVYICQYATICERLCLWSNNLSLQREESYKECVYASMPSLNRVWPPKIVCSYDIDSRNSYGWIGAENLYKWNNSNPSKDDFHSVKLLKTNMYVEDLEDRTGNGNVENKL